MLTEIGNRGYSQEAICNVLAEGNGDEQATNTECTLEVESKLIGRVRRRSTRRRMMLRFGTGTGWVAVAFAEPGEMGKRRLGEESREFFSSHGKSECLSDSVDTLAVHFWERCFQLLLPEYELSML